MTAVIPLQTALLSDVGRVRKNNEDAIGEDLEHGLLVLADGMGGYQAGEVASQLAVSTILSQVRGYQALLEDPAPAGAIESVAKLLRQAVERANTAICASARENPQQEGMGTTVVAGLIYARHFLVANVGDSRCYLLRNGVFTQITKDHSLVQEMVDAGQYTREQAQRVMSKSIVTRALGVETDVRVDLFDTPMEDDDVLMMCSDGLSDMLSDEAMQQILSDHSTNLKRAAQTLVSQANANGGRDNISVILARADQIAATPI
jgi:protein phosphatase